jgi:hypothetical protein
MNVFGRKRGPDKAFVHQEGCRIQAADPSVSIPWNEVRAGYWEARCVCGVEGWYAPNTGRVRRNDPYDPATAHHFGQCEYVSETETAMLRVLLKITDKATTTGSNAVPARPAGRFRTTPRASGDDEPEVVALRAGGMTTPSGAVLRAAKSRTFRPSNERSTVGVGRRAARNSRGNGPDPRPTREERCSLRWYREEQHRSCAPKWTVS